MGATAMVTIAEVYQCNGVIHVVDKVLLPKWPAVRPPETAVSISSSALGVSTGPTASKKVPEAGAGCY
jgi:hypothetical protein